MAPIGAKLLDRSVLAIVYYAHTYAEDMRNPPSAPRARRRAGAPLPLSRPQKRPAPPAGRFAFSPGGYGCRVRCRSEVRAAAFFDLDRTLLRGGVRPGDLRRPCSRSACCPERTIPGESLLFRVFELFGENRLAMERHPQRRAVHRRVDPRPRPSRPASWPPTPSWAWSSPSPGRSSTSTTGRRPPCRARHDHAVRRRAPLRRAPRPRRRDRHPLRRARRRHLRRHHRRGVRVGRGQARGRPPWAEERGSTWPRATPTPTAYYDLPLLSAVGHPDAVNPDPRLLAERRRCAGGPCCTSTCPPASPRSPWSASSPSSCSWQLARLERILPFARFDIEGWEHIPTDGPAIVVGNHRSYFDPLAIGVTLAKRGRPVRFLGKKEVFDVARRRPGRCGPWVASGSTGAPAPTSPSRRRRPRCWPAQLVALMPEGTIPRGPAFFDPDLKGRWGAARLAAMQRRAGHPGRAVGHRAGVAPLEPDARHAGTVLNPPTVRIRVGPPVEGLDGTDRRRRHRRGSWRRSSTCSRPRPTSAARRRPRSSPAPTRRARCPTEPGRARGRAAAGDATEPAVAPDRPLETGWLADTPVDDNLLAQLRRQPGRGQRSCSPLRRGGRPRIRRVVLTDTGGRSPFLNQAFLRARSSGSTTRSSTTSSRSTRASTVAGVPAVDVADAGPVRPRLAAGRAPEPSWPEGRGWPIPPPAPTDGCRGAATSDARRIDVFERVFCEGYPMPGARGSRRGSASPTGLEWADGCASASSTATPSPPARGSWARASSTCAGRPRCRRRGDRRLGSAGAGPHGRRARPAGARLHQRLQPARLRPPRLPRRDQLHPVGPYYKRTRVSVFRFPHR